MKYLRKFATEAEVFMAKTPNAVLVEDTKKVLYNIDSSGAYIQHIDGKLYRPEDWTANAFDSSAANGVALVTEDCSFVIAKADLPKLYWANSSKLVEGIGTATEKETALKDFAGLQNTQKISELGAENNAAYSCSQYIFPNGANGYLPALGELGAIKANRTKINTALNACGGTSLDLYGIYWSSTQYDKSSAWTWTVNGGSISYYSKYSQRGIRVITPLEI